MSTLSIVGATGLVGSAFTALANPVRLPAEISSVTTITRSPLSNSSSAVTSIVNPNILASLPSNTKILFSGLGTTRAAAGGIENQRKIDYDLNLEIAKAAKAAGASTYVLVSSSSASAESSFPYVKMKGELERDVIALGFDKTIILHPGLLIGERSESRPAEKIAQIVTRGIRSIPGLGNSLTSSIAIDATDVAKAAWQTVLNPPAESVVKLSNSEMIKMAREFDAASSSS
ncbi:uncharacterized protein V1516DRAFT_667333 [Lipomyces oligophaga]|uniref:uncharacterized protein n=1 Tax=Lipomyces oligophaga TaxID=45792 RepID=UPI0034CE75F6